MDNQVLLTLTGRQWDEEKNETVTEQSAPGTLYERNGSLYILYDEKTEEGGTVKNTIKLKGTILELTKKGIVNTCMVFEPGREHMTDFVTPFGSLRLGVLTDSVEMRESEEQMEITSSYMLTESGRIISHCKISIKILNRGKFIGFNSRYK